MIGEATFETVLDAHLAAATQAAARAVPPPIPIAGPFFDAAPPVWRDRIGRARYPAAPPPHTPAPPTSPAPRIEEPPRAVSPVPGTPSRTRRFADPRRQRALEYLQDAGAVHIDASSSDEDLRRAYRALARAWHPDAHPDADDRTRAALARRFARIAAAYRIVSGRVRRRRL